MYLSDLRISNIRGFHDERDAEISLTRPDGSYAGWTVIAGRNGSGKSSFLRAIALAVSGPGVTRSLIPDFESWVSSGKSRGSVAVRIEHDPNFEGFGAGRPPKTGFWAGLQWAAPDDRENGSRRGSQPTMQEYHVLTKGRSLPRRGPWSDNPNGWFCAAYGPFRRLAGGGGDVQRLMLSQGPVARLASLFHEDASLAEGVAWLIEQHLRSLESKPGAEQLKEAALQILGDGLLPDAYQIESVDSDGLWVEMDGYRFPLREMSDGYRTVASLVVDLLKQINEAYGGLKVAEVDGRPAVISPGVVIIDEVDAHLHVSWQKRIGEWLKAHFPAVQFIVTTHSPYICQSADPSGLIRLPGPDQDEPPRVVAQDMYERIVYGTGDDAVLSELFGLDTPFSERAERLRAELAELEFSVATGRADNRQKTRYTELRHSLTSSPASRVAEITSSLEISARDDQ